MSEKLNSIVGKQNDFVTRAMSGGSIALSSPGTILTLTPPAGQRVRLTHLSIQTGFQGGISVAFGATDVLSVINISGDNPSAVSSSYSVGSFQDYAAGVPPSGNYDYFTGGTDEPLTIVKDAAGSTTNIIYYGYQFGE